jgi:outer membrane receptor protein involved in Fe transport
MSKKVHVALFLSIIIIGYIFGGTTGKISGIITDSETGEGVVGANIQIEGTALGAATDADGVYVILNVPPGLYTISISYIGYQTVLVKDVRVNVDFTTRLDQSLKPTVIEGSIVEVYGERNPLVRQDLTNTQVAVTADQIDELPVDQIGDIIALQAGVVEDNDGALHIRGGRSNEIAYQVNGISINNPFGNSQGVGLATNAVEEVSVSAGTFSAEYGNALSGVVNFVTKDGGPDYHATLKGYTGDNFSSHKDIFFNIDDIDLFNNSRVEGTLSGPVPLLGKKFTFATSGVWQKDKGYLYGIRLYNPEDLLLLFGDNMVIDPFGYSFQTSPDGSVAVSADPSRRGASGDGEIVPMVTREALNLTGKLTWKPYDNLKISYDVIFDDVDRYNRVADGVNVFRRFRFTPDGRPKTVSYNTSHSLGITHTLNKKTFYTFKVGVNLNYARTSVFDDVFGSGLVPSLENNILNEIIQPTDYVAGGMDLNRTIEKSRSIMGKLDVVSQILPNHELKFGAEFTRHRMDLDYFTLLFDFDEDRFIIPSADRNPNFTDFQSYIREPVQASFYILDKIELAQKFILNAGIRYEFLDTDAQYNPDLAGTVDQGVDNPAFLKKATPKHRLAPRVSLSFPITSRGIIRFSYGFFYQNPTFRNIYRNPRFEDFDFLSTPTFGNPNLKPQRSIQYEMGLQQQFTDDVKMDLTVYYKDVNDLIEERRVVAGEVAISKEFNITTNVSYASVKGFTVALLKRRSSLGFLSGSLDYTFQVAQGAFTDPLDLAIDTRTGRETAQKFVPLDFDRTHILNGVLTFGRTNNWLASVIGRIQSGTPYTPSVPTSLQAVEFEVNSSRRPMLANIDLKLEKFFKAWGARFSVFMQVENALDSKNERFVHLNTGHSLTNLDETRQPTLFNNLRATIAADPNDFFPVEFLDTFYQREDFLSEPREIRWGMTFAF